MSDGREHNEHCTWHENEDGVWGIDCGHLFQFTAGGPTENHFAYCPYCGQEITAVPWKETSDE